jgi:photosystem II stability/assembly factor-like uncharacterized protein
MSKRQVLGTGATTLALLALAGCGGDDSDGGGGTTRPPREAAEMSHIHGVGVDPADGSVVVATHSGLFRAREGEQRAKRIGDRHQDTMGFTVVGPRRYLGSGHPDLRDLRNDVPPLLGLILSTDGGRNWHSVSLLGKADFHVLRAAGERIYGVDSANDRFLVSSDGGQTWKRRKPPAAVIDLAPDPDNPTEVVASTEQGLHASNDGGATWRPLAEGVGGLLARTSDGGLVVVDGEGSVLRSTDGGRSFEDVGDVGGQPAAFSAAGEELYVALHTNEVKASTDGGRSWALRVAPS